MTCFWWQLAHNITIHIIRLSLKKGFFWDECGKIPTFAGCHFATHPKSKSSGTRRICLQVILVFVLESSEYPSRLCPVEVALLVNFLKSTKSKNFMVNLGFPLDVFRFTKLLVVSSYFLG